MHLDFLLEKKANTVEDALKLAIMAGAAIAAWTAVETFFFSDDGNNRRSVQTPPVVILSPFDGGTTHDGSDT